MRAVHEDVTNVLGVLVPSRYQQRSHMPVIGAGLRQRGPNWKASICTRNMVSFRLGQSPEGDARAEESPSRAGNCIVEVGW